MSARRHPGFRPAMGVCALAASLGSGAACAGVTVGGDVAPQWEYNSNVFYLPGGLLIPGTAISDHADSYTAIRALLQSSFSVSDQLLYANVGGADVRYSRFTTLNHNEYNFDGGLNWSLGRELNGSLDVSRTRAAVSFSALLVAQSQLALQTEQRETAIAKYLFNPDWRLDAVVFNHKIEVPLPELSNLNLQGTSGTLSLTYVKNAGLTAGFSAGYEHGHYEGGVDGIAPTYRQVTAGMVATYSARGLSAFNGQLGYTQRTSSNNANNLSGATGSFDYFRRLTGKTAFDLSLNRTISNTVTNSGSEVDTGASFALRWDATYRMQVQLGASYTIRFLPDQGFIPHTDRTDHEIYETAALVYKVARWLDVQPYVSLRNRSSESVLTHYNASIYGITVTGRFGQAPPTVATTEGFSTPTARH